MTEQLTALATLLLGIALLFTAAICQNPPLCLAPLGLVLAAVGFGWLLATKALSLLP